MSKHLLLFTNLKLVLLCIAATSRAIFPNRVDCGDPYWGALKPSETACSLTKSKTDSSFGPGATGVGHFGGSGPLATQGAVGICSLLLTNNFSHASHFYNRRRIMNAQAVRKPLHKTRLTPTRPLTQKKDWKPSLRLNKMWIKRVFTACSLWYFVNFINGSLVRLGL